MNLGPGVHQVVTGRQPPGADVRVFADQALDPGPPIQISPSGAVVTGHRGRHDHPDRALDPREAGQDRRAHRVDLPIDGEDVRGGEQYPVGVSATLAVQAATSSNIARNSGRSSSVTNGSRTGFAPSSNTSSAAAPGCSDA
ncbi:hypothetical protein IU443_16575 [Nocardia farcinica]|uniref:hypothetical protein n=1 Tax=Nocardia farcinica TaxID=37329 RepID=UPI001894F6FF|nr:hypothetical protein [Nocardia farcinica]MBF6261639.1 hypothetical protein [Nocardia farcinica]MBF6280178.1 hypothetical protein [Nocardia farcinica]MBF6305366.1 hypothetical protein [Nocardia farcinica]MBF6391565.1 hypothetical protein [Nocardia farcinica]MBF6493796.1 hypothetical protein [Nocardia farcinica]